LPDPNPISQSLAELRPGTLKTPFEEARGDTAYNGIGRNISGHHVDLKSQQLVTYDVWQNLRDGAVADLIKPAATCGFAPLKRTHVDVFIDLRIEVARRAGGVQSDRENTCQSCPSATPVWFEKCSRPDVAALPG